MPTNLTDQQVERLTEALYDLGDESHLRRYGGRLYGDESLAIRTDGDPVSVIKSIIHGLMADDGDDEGRELADLLVERHTRTAQIGLGSVIYWPSLGLPASFDAKEDE